MDVNILPESHNVFHRGVYKVIYKSVHIESKKDLTFTVENYIESSNLKIIISDERDPCFLCVIFLTKCNYEELKKQQGLLIDFDSFPLQLVRLLQQSVDGNMFLTLQQNADASLVLDVVEHNEFKRLVHLSLRTGPASDADIKKNMAQSVLHLKKRIAELSKKLSDDESIFKEKEQMLETRVKDLNAALCRMQDEKALREADTQEIIRRERDKLDEERREWKKCAELHSQSQVVPMQETLSRREQQLEEAQARCRHLQDTINSMEAQIMDKGQRIISLEKQLHTARSDAETWRNQNAALDREYHDKDVNLQHARTKMLDIEKNLKDKSDMLREALDSLQTVKREKNILEDRIAALEVLSSKHKTEAQTSAEQLMKANQIITKLNNDLIEMREKLMCRTAIALEQEKVIERHGVEREGLERRGKELEGELVKLRTDLELANIETDRCRKMLEEKEDVIKNNNTVIQWLHKKADIYSGGQDTLPTGASREMRNSTPYLYSGDRNLSENNNDIVSAYNAGLNLKSSREKASRISVNSDESITEVNDDDLERYRAVRQQLKSGLSHRSKSQESSKSAKDDLLTSKSGRTTSKTTALSTNRSSKSTKSTTVGKKPLSANKKTDSNSNPLSPISAYFSRP